MNSNKSYFAAANGYDGFKSYFGEVFNSDDYTRIFVLKGGPGTGKSSLMKAICTNLENKGAMCERIYCSSDPASLDGIICEKEDKRVAIIDGTSPHERDAVIPGAIDEIINLGENWSPDWLTSKREEVLDLCKEKKNAYLTAYSYLKIAGEASRQAKRHLYCGYDANKLKKGAKSLADSLKTKNGGNVKTRLISSFGKLGRHGLDTFNLSARQKYSVKGDITFVHDFLNYLKEELYERCADMTVAPSPLDKTATEAIFLPGEDILISTSEGGNIIDVESMVTEKDKTVSEKIKAMREIESISLENSARWFSIASDMHFRLEEIYQTSMNFEENDKIIKEKSKVLSEILGL
ncbi:MAG: hypothetical protein IJX92_06170 [Clostridia bacterium]|nr:hypothetical protein [Clostridia bacterium]